MYSCRTTTEGKDSLALIAALLVTLFAVGAWAEDATDGSPGDWVSRYASARAAGMGGAFMALAEEPVAALYNPAGVSWLERSAVQAGSTRLFESTSINGLGLAMPSNRRPSFALNLLNLRSGDFERTNELNETLGTFAEGDLVLGLAASQPLTRGLSVGAQVKVVRQEIEEFSASGVGFDFGVMGRLPGDLRVGASVANLGGPTLALRLKDESFPTELRGGVALPLLGGDGLIALDAVHRDGPGTQLHAGARFSLQALDLSLGYHIDNIAAGFSYGFDNGLRLDYGMSDHELGMVHRFGVTYRFGGFFADAQAQPAMFSPTGRNPVTKIELTARTKADARAWQMAINDRSGVTVRSFAGQGQPPAHIIWDGKDAAGLPLPDGSYTYRLTVTDGEGQVLDGRERVVEIATGGPTGIVEVRR